MSDTSVQELYIVHHSWLSTFIQRRVSCPQLTADLIQDTYLRILSSGRLPQRQDARRFLTHIAKGLLIDNYRRRQIEEAYQTYLLQQPEHIMVSPEVQLEMIEILTELDKMLSKLPDKMKKALLLKQLDNLTYKEIADELNVSVSSVEKYIAKALKHCVHFMLKQEN